MNQAARDPLLRRMQRKLAPRPITVEQQPLAIVIMVVSIVATAAFAGGRSDSLLRAWVFRFPEQRGAESVPCRESNFATPASNRRTSRIPAGWD